MAEAALGRTWAPLALQLLVPGKEDRKHSIQMILVAARALEP